MDDGTYIKWLEELTNDDVGSVGGKNASLGEMIRELREEGVRVPGGFAALPVVPVLQSWLLRLAG